MASFDDFNNEWRGEISNLNGCEPPDGGLVLKNITHQHYNFAKDVRVIGFWITYDKIEKSNTSQESHFYIIDRVNFSFNCIEQLKESDLNTSSSPSEESSSSPSDPAHFLHYIMRYKYYKYVFGIKARYTSKSALLPPNCEASILTITQSYLFTRKSNSPGHEPRGTLPAARFYPQIHTDFTSNQNFKSTVFPQYKIKSIRFDYRIHLNLDHFKGVPSPLPVGTISPNFAAVFKDTSLTLPVGTSVARAIFAAAEKPLVLEITAKGYERGSSKLLNNSSGWDNIHWWGARTADDGTLTHISAPGAFFAVHFHWHWGPSNRVYIPGLVPEGGKGQFRGTLSANSPIIDKSIRNQTLSFAIVRYSTTKDPNMVSTQLSHPNFFDLFTPTNPAYVSQGGNLVMWLSVEINRDTDNLNSFNGTQLIHGFFFAHSPEPPGFSPTTGSTTSEYFPNDFDTVKKQNQWERY